MTQTDDEPEGEPAIDDKEWPDEADMDEDMLDDTIPCPYCKKPIYEQAEFCPHCGKYISEEDRPNPKALWIMIGVALCILIIVFVWAL